MINMLWLDVEFNHLRARAGQLVNRGPWLLRLGIRPSFDPWCTIGVLRKQMTDTLVVRRWDSESDAAKFRSPLQRLKHGWRLAPTITDATAATDASLLDRVLSDLATIQPPLSVDPNILVLDGIEFSLDVNTGDRRFALSWNTDPGAWLPLAEWFARTWRAMHAHLNQPCNQSFPWERPER